MANGSPGDRLTTTRVLVQPLPVVRTRRVSTTRTRLERAKVREARAKAREEMVAKARVQAKEKGTCKEEKEPMNIRGEQGAGTASVIR